MPVRLESNGWYSGWRERYCVVEDEVGEGPSLVFGDLRHRCGDVVVAVLGDLQGSAFGSWILNLSLQKTQLKSVQLSVNPAKFLLEPLEILLLLGHGPEFIVLTDGDVNVVSVVALEVDPLLSEVDGFDGLDLPRFETAVEGLLDVLVFAIACFIGKPGLQGVHTLHDGLH